MKAMKIVGIAVAVAAAALALEAGTVVHYSLDSGEIGDLPAHGSTVVNVANPGVNDARLYGLKNSAIDSTSANMPYVTNGIPVGYRVYDPVSGQFPPAGVQDRALRFTAGQGSSQAAVLQVENNASLRPESFTVEAMVRFPIGADLTQWSAIAVHPAIMKCANADAWGLRFINNRNLRVRFSPQQEYVEKSGKPGEYNNATGNVEVGATLAFSVCDGRWHHVAFTATPGASDSSKTDVKVFFDYLQKASGTVNFRPQFSTEENCPLWIGATCQGATPFTGEIGEFRFSDEVLEPRQFLRPRSKRYDPDVILHYSFDGIAWFGSVNGGANNELDLVNNDADPCAMNGNFMTNVLDGVGTFPRVASGSIYEMMSPAKGADLFWASSSSLENAYADVDHRVANTRVYAYPVDDWFCKTNFTVECFYKANGDMEATGVFVVRESQFKLGVGTKNHLSCMVGANNDAWVGRILVTDPDAFVDDQWHHAAMVVRQGESIRLYRDYRQVAEEELPTNVYAKPNVDTVPIGVSGGYNYNVFKGLLDEVRVTLRALEPHEFIHEYKKPGFAIFVR